ncbi:MAG: DUF3575 domain-containing protein [Tannerellaceae bacterium]|nr:DUF3575 domain-containing protein [Tannerellaceae bacterium]
MKKLYLLLMVGVFHLCTLNGQTVAVKTNLLYDLTTTINLEGEVKIAPGWTLGLSGNYNPWNFSNDKKIKHWLIQPEVRYWLCESFAGHFFGAHLHYGEYNVGNILGIKGYRYDGNLYGAGLSYGYQWLLNKRWSIEGTLGVGFAHLDREKFTCGACGEKLNERTKNYIGPTRAAISLIYIIK